MTKSHQEDVMLIKNLCLSMEYGVCNKPY